MKVEKSTRVTRWFSKLLNSGGTNFVPLGTNFIFLKTLSYDPKKYVLVQEIKTLVKNFNLPVNQKGFYSEIKVTNQF